MGLTTELETSYAHLMAEMAKTRQSDKIAASFSLLEKIADPVRDIETIFRKDPELLQNPKQWLDALRLLRFSVELRNRLSKLYDGFVSAYQSLAQKADPDADEKKLKEEISALMYNVDENSGKHERLSKKLFSEIAFQMGLNQSLGNSEGFLYANMDPKIRPRIHELCAELLQISVSFSKDYEIALALERMEKLILSPRNAFS